MSFPLFNKKFLKSEYALYKNRAYEYLQNGNLSKSLKCIEYCGLIAWFYPIIEQFCDDELENLIVEISKKHYVIKELKENRENRIVFYNSQIVDSGGLTEQYLNYFIMNQYEVLFIVPHIKSTKMGKGILDIIEKNHQITLFIAKDKDPLHKIQSIVDEIVRYSPGKAFLHFTPADVVGFGSFYNFKTIKRYYIVHNDHTFWYGKLCSDYYLEFRKLGYLIATQRRGISSSQIYHLPYYPIQQKIPFQGFPFDTEGKLIGFSGANLYKYYLDPDLKYFNAIKELLLRNPNFVFCLAGFGDSTIIENFIEINQLQNRFFFLGRRKDFYELISNIDILFESYPLKGGLTVLYGVENHKAITGIGDNRNASGCLEDFFDITNYQQPCNFEDFLVEAEHLIKSKTARKFNVAKFEFTKYNRIDFESGLSLILKGALPGNVPIYNEKLNLDDEYYLNEYLKIPDAEYKFYLTKLFELKSILSLKERISVFYHLYRLKPQAIRKRFIRYMLLVAIGN